MAFIKLIEGTWLAADKVIAVAPYPEKDYFHGNINIIMLGGTEFFTEENIDTFMDRLANTLNLTGIEV
jgi:heptaprenylglyceryl phosphate synthase